MKFTYAQKILILTAVIFVSVLVLDIIFSNLLLDDVTNINDNIKQLNLSSKERERELSLKDSIASSKIEREKLEEYFVSAGNAETVKFTQFLEDLASELNLTHKKSLDYESIAGVPATANLLAIRFKFNVSGSWVRVYTFLQAIESLPKITSLNSVVLTLDQAVSTDGKEFNGKIWTAELDFSVIKLK